MEKFKILSVDEVFDKIMERTYEKEFKVDCATFLLSKAMTNCLFRNKLVCPYKINEYDAFYDALTAYIIYNYNNCELKHEIISYVNKNSYYEKLNPVRKRMFKDRVDEIVYIVITDIERMDF